MALPGENDRAYSPPQRWRLAIGETYVNKNEMTLPRKMDYFTTRRLSYQTGQSPTYIVDTEMQAMLCKAAGVMEKPTAVPVTVIGNPSLDAEGKPVIPESILFSEMARYGGRKRLCWCKEFDADGRGTATCRTYTERKTRDGKRTYQVLTTEEAIICDPATCPWATGTHSIDKYEGSRLCKPHVIATISFPWAPSVGSAAKFRTTGWKSYHAMRASLIAIALQTKGWLHEVPLTMVLDWTIAGNGEVVPEVRFEYRGTAAELRSASIEVKQLWTGQEQELKQLEAGIVADTEAFIVDPVDEAATQDEFWPEGQAAGNATRLVTPPAEEQDAEAPLPEGVAEGEFEPETPTPDPDAPPPPSLLDDEETKAGQVGAWFKAIGQEQTGLDLWEAAQEEPAETRVASYRAAARAWWETGGWRCVEAHALPLDGDSA